MKLVENREGYLVSDTHRECTKCGTIFEKSGGYTMTVCKSCNTKRVKSQDLVSKMLSRARSRSRLNNIPFDITKDDIQIPKYCPILGIRLKENSGKPGGNKSSPSLDKIVPELGYVKDNIQVISNLANMMKANATPYELLKFAEWVLEVYSEDN